MARFTLVNNISDGVQQNEYFTQVDVGDQHLDFVATTKENQHNNLVATSSEIHKMRLRVGNKRNQTKHRDTRFYVVRSERLLQKM